MNAGDIRVDLELDDKHFRLTAREAGRVLRSLERQLGDVGKGVNALESHFGSFTTKLRHTVVTLMAVRFAAIDFYDVFLRLPRAILQTSGEIERLTKLMEGLSEATDEASRKTEGGKNLAMIFDLARRTPFEVKTLADAFVKFKSGGLDPTTGTLQALTDSVAKFGGTSETMHRASVAIQQMAGKGVISMEELRQQLGEAVPNAMRAMAIGTGMSMQDLIKHISKGEVESKGALERMFAVMRAMNAGAAREMMETWPGLLSRLKTEWQLFADQVAKNEFMPAIKQVAEDIIRLLQSTEAQQFAVDFGRSLATAVDFLRSMAQALRENWELIKTVATVAATAWGISKVYEMTRAIQSFTTHLAGPYRQALDQARVQHQAIYQEKARAMMQALNQELAAAAALKTAETELSRMRAAEVSAAISKRQALLLVQSQEVIAAQAHVNALRAQHAALAAHTARVAESVVAVERLGIATRAATMAKTAFQGIVAALGGPIGVAITALSMLAMWFATAESAADKARAALERFDRAKLGMSTRDDLAKDQAALNELLKQRADMEFARDQAAGMSDEKSMTAYQAEIDRINALIAQKEQAIKLHRENVQRSSVDAEFALLERTSDKRIQEIQRLNNAETQAINNAFAQKIENAKGNQKQIEELTKQHGEVLRAQQAKNLKAERDVIVSLRTDLQDELKTRLAKPDKVGAESIRRLIDKYEERLNVLNQEMIRAGLIGTKTPLISKKSDKETAATADPLVRALEKARGDAIVALDRVTEIEEDTRSFETIKARVMRQIEAARKAGEFNFKRGKELVDRSKGSFADLPEADRRMLEEKANLQASTELYKERAKAMSAANVLLADKSLEAAQAMRQLDADQAKLPPAFANLEQRFASLRAVLAGDNDALQEFNRKVSDILGKQATVESVGVTTKLLQKNEEVQAQLFDTEEQRREASYRAERRKADQEFRMMEQLLETRIRFNEMYLIEDTALIRSLEQLRVSFYENTRLMAEKHARDMETPLQRLNRDWQDVTKQMQDATARWAQSGVDAIVQFVKTGKMNFKSLVDSIITDLLRIQIQKNVVGPLSGVLDQLGKGLAGAILGGGAPTPIGGGDYEFAKGGIMTRFGAAQIQRYAEGGIANRPQVALFGEGATPEAFVPLPDGRNIPVKMDAAPANVQVNVINQSGVPMKAEQGQPRMDGKQLILDVVLTAASTPGPFREGMRHAVGG